MVVNDTYVSKIRIEVLLVPLPATHRIRTHDATSLLFPFRSSDFVLVARSHYSSACAAIIVIMLGLANPVDRQQSSMRMCFCSIIERKEVS